MPYKRPLIGSKKYISSGYTPHPSYSMSSPEPFEQKDFYGIPLPNEREGYTDHMKEKRALPSLYGIVNYIRRHIKIEEIMLIGLIVLMLDESIEDDLLLIILIYILLF